MHSYLRPIDISDFSEAERQSVQKRPIAGAEPELRWIEIRYLMVDTRYQREIARAGRKNVLQIASGFDWSKFGTVIVAPVEDDPDLYAIVDGQHHVTSAKLRGCLKVPCQVIEGNLSQQAAAFAYINGQVTAMTPLQIHAARVAAGEPEALALRDACAAGGVTICRYPVPGNAMKPGETLAVGQMAKLYKLYGPGLLGLALRCITKTGDGNPGMVRSAVVKALCSVLDAEPAYRRNEARLLQVLEDFHFEGELDNAALDRHKRKCSIDAALSATLLHFLDKRFDTLKAA